MSNWWKQAWHHEDAAVIPQLILFFAGMILAFGVHQMQFGALCFAASGVMSIILSPVVTRVINRINHAHYTKRLPIIWGIAMITFALTLLLK